MKPRTVATPCSWVARSTSCRRHPASTWASFASTSTLTVRMRAMSIMRPPSGTAVPAMLWPAPLTPRSTPWSRANSTAATTSRADPACTTSAGVLSTMPFQMRTASSQPSSPGRRSAPSMRDARSSSWPGVTFTSPPSRPVTSIVVTVMSSFSSVSRSDHRSFGRVPGTELVVPLAGAVDGDLADPPAHDLAHDEAARRPVLAVDVLVLDVLGHEPRRRRHRAQDLDAGGTLVDARQLRRERVPSLQLEPPFGHVQVAEHVRHEGVLAGLEGREDVVEPGAQPLCGRRLDGPGF